YRVIEVDEDGNEITSTADYTPSYGNSQGIYDKETGYISTGNDGQLNVTNTYNKFNATVNKDWRNAPSNHPEVIFTLWKKVGENGDWVNTKQTKTLSNGSTSVTFDELPKTENGQTVYYKVVESDIKDYTITYPDNFISKDNTSWTVTNTYDKMAINAIKNWVGDEGSKEKRDRLTITFKLQYTTNSNPDAENDSMWNDISSDWNIADTTKTLTGSQDEDVLRYTWTELPRKDASGNTIHYRVRETQSNGSDYETEYKTEVVTSPDSYDADYIINNVYQKVNITPQKKWVGDEPSTREDIVVKLQYKAGTDGTWEDHDTSNVEDIRNANNITITVDKRNDADDTDTANSSWKNLPKEVNGVKYYYRAVEVNVPAGYVETYDETGRNQTGNSVITNTLNTIEIIPAKKWVGDEDNTGDRYSVTFKLQWKYEGDSSWNDTLENVVAPVGQKGTITISKQDGSDEWVSPDKWSGLPKTNDVNGVRKNIQYKVVEVTENENYTASPSSITSVSDTLTVINTYNFFKITASKNWASDSPSDRPQTIKVHLEKTTTPDNNDSWTIVDNSEQEFEVTGASTTLTHESWNRLPKKDGENAVYYRVVEDSVKGYNATYEPATISGNSGTVVITNTKKEEYSKTAIELSKDNNNNIDNIKDSTVISSLNEITNISKDRLQDVPTFTDTDDSVDYYIFAYKVSIPKGGNVEYIDKLPGDASFYPYLSNDKLYA
ncbi:MAG: Cna B-type domain-containing protein, partial [Ruminococcus sp.]|nr:Cna B-type domain-containing protein [Ruminococcus sp.]